MTLMKLRIGRKKLETSLKPLTEKEIQKRLYGAYQEEGEGRLKEEIESILAEPRRKEKGPVFSPEKRASLRQAWQKSVSSLSKAFAGFVKFSAKFLQKTVSGWGAGLLIVALLFLGIHVLNGYRAKAMKASRPQTRFVEAGSKEIPALPLSSPTTVQAQAPPPSPLPPPSPRKPYVIQVCTYASQTDAEGLVEKMKAANLPAFVEPVGRANGKTFYPVFLGRFETFQEAQAKLKEFRGKPVSGDFQDSFIRTL